MRVLHLYAGNLYGGIETMLVTLARCRHLCPQMEPHFALCFEGRLSQELREAGSPVHLLGATRFSRPWTIWQARRTLANVLAHVRPDFVVAHECWVHALFAPVVRRLRVPLVFWAHDAHQGHFWLERWAKRTAPDLVIANSRYTAATLEHLFPGIPRAVIYCLVPAPALADLPTVRRAVRTELETPQDAIVVIQASRLERWKGHTLLLDSLAQLRDVPNWILWLAGGAQRPVEKAYLAELQAQVARTGLADRVRFLGQRQDVPRLLAAADIHCQPNLGPEPFGIAFVEALYAGLPVVTTAMGGALEIVTDTCGRLVPPADEVKLTEVLRLLAEHADTRRLLGAAGPKRAETLCGPTHALPELRELLVRTFQKEMAA
jgi:glycosyltransferase involved in cell wall biosynthesis